MNRWRRPTRVLVVFVESVLLAAALVLLAESLGWHVLSQAGGVAASAASHSE